MNNIFELNDINSKLDYIKTSAPSIYENILPNLENTGAIDSFRNRIIIEDAVLEAFELSGNQAIITSDIYDVLAIGKYLTKETTAHIDGKYKVIHDRCFSNCSTLETVVFEEGVECIREAVLCDNPTIKSISFPKSLKTIGEVAFQNCENLSDVTFLNSQTWISPTAFTGTKWFEQFTEDFVIVNGQLLKYNGMDKILQIPEGTVHIANFVFNNNENIEAIICPSSLEGIWSFSFANCVNLKNVAFNNKLKMIAIGAFEDCINLKEVDLPKSLEELGAMAFNNNTFVTFYDTDKKLTKHIKKIYPRHKIIQKTR